jgi:hypothetical protein
MLIAPVHAEDDGPVQVLTGHYESDSILLFTLPDLTQGDTLYVYCSGESGNLDPFIGLSDTFYDSETLAEDFLSEVDRAIAQGRDPLEAIPEIADGLFLIWDSHSGTGHDAALEFQIAANRSYQLLVSNHPFTRSFGDFKLTIGLNQPSVLTGNAEPTGDIIAVFDKQASGMATAVEEIRGTLTANKTSTFFFLNQIEAGNTLYVYAEATSGDLRPQVVLKDFGERPLRSGNFGCNQTTATLQYTFDERASNYILDITSCSNNEEVTTGDYRLLVGLNAPEVLSGNAVSRGRSLLRPPIVVQVGFFMDQIINVNQQEEHYSIVGTIQAEWTDPKLAYSPDTCQCKEKLFRAEDFLDFVTEEGIVWPAFTIFNQQGRRFAQNLLVVIIPDGSVLYFERFTTTIQSPNFDYRAYPFDKQEFLIHIDSLIPEEYYVYELLEGFSGIGENLGLDEWVITEIDTSISSQQYGSRYTFSFKAHRQMSYYFIRIFIPLMLIIIVTWVTFFLKDYMRRIEFTAANLLLFIAFNFTLGSDLPTLGYITFADGIMMTTFVISAAAVVFNVVLRRLDITERGALAGRIDKYTIWVYPLAYAGAFGLLALFLL